jgi:hypothetical protein
MAIGKSLVHIIVVTIINNAVVGAHEAEPGDAYF